MLSDVAMLHCLHKLSIYTPVISVYLIYGHTKQEALHPVRSAKLSCLGPRQYYGGGPHGNPRCRRSFFLPAN